jgi:predicted amidohydrolase
MNVPDDLKYAESHEWIRVDGDTGTVGITDHAQNELTDIVYVDPPKVGATVTAGQPAAVVESVKAASDIYAPVDGEGRLREAVLRARARGVFFDVGHGMGSFSWDSARKALAAGFVPDTISSDVHAMCITGPAWDLLRTMTKFIALGLSLSEVITATTTRAALALRRPELGHLGAGAAGDASVLELAEMPTPLEDVLGEVVDWPQRLVPRGMVIGGRWETL